MISTRRALALGTLLVAGAYANARGEERQGDPEAILSGGSATVFDATKNAFSLPVPGLDAHQRSAFFVGNSLFNQNWIAAPASVASRDGLGPLFNARSCSTCHFKDGRGQPPELGEPLRSMLLRISVSGEGPHGEPAADRVYGDQIQSDALPGLPREADVRVRYTRVQGTFEDGSPYELRAPHYALSKFGYGPPARGLRVSPRVAPALIGLGLLEAVPEADLTGRADPEDRDRDGISGRVNIVWDMARGSTALGRFGWKAEQPTVRQQNAAAFLGDMGITSDLFPRENATKTQAACERAPNGGAPELSASALDAVTSYARTLAVPAKRGMGEPSVRTGEQLFFAARCAACHVPELRTGQDVDVAALRAQTIRPYTDLLLHDMGEGLADDRPSYEASGREWRTPPLWGLGLVREVNGHTFFLHDGRARDLMEAILWHGGEAEQSKRAFVAMDKARRAALIAFLESL